MSYPSDLKDKDWDLIEHYFLQESTEIGLFTAAGALCFSWKHHSIMQDMRIKIDTLQHA